MAEGNNPDTTIIFYNDQGVIVKGLTVPMDDISEEFISLNEIPDTHVYVTTVKLGNISDYYVEIDETDEILPRLPINASYDGTKLVDLVDCEMIIMRSPIELEQTNFQLTDTAERFSTQLTLPVAGEYKLLLRPIAARYQDQELTVTI